MMNTPATAIRAMLAIATLLLGSNTASALPPTGLTQIRSTADTSADLAVIDGVAYASSMEGIYAIDSSGVNPLVAPSNPGFNSLIDTTRVVQTVAEEIFYLAGYDGSGTFFGPGPGLALFNLNDPVTPTAVWGGEFFLAGIDSDLRGLGFNPFLASFEFFPDNSRNLLTVGPPADFFLPEDVTPNGTSIGLGVPTVSQGASPALLLPNGEVEFLAVFGLFTDIREREDGSGVNSGYVGNGFGLHYGDIPVINIDLSIGVDPSFEGGIQVSETDFTIVEAEELNTRDGFEEFRVYYPGVNPAGTDRSVSLFDIFPELNALDFNRVLDISSVDGQIHMLLSGNDGLWLFAAPDPSVVPEPSGMLLIGTFLAIMCASPRNHRRH